MNRGGKKNHGREELALDSARIVKPAATTFLIGGNVNDRLRCSRESRVAELNLVSPRIAGCQWPVHASGFRFGPRSVNYSAGRKSLMPGDSEQLGNFRLARYD